jgi:DNA-binding protein HU-beta
MVEARRMGKSELFAHFAERFDMKRAQARELFDELTVLAEKELKRSGEFVLPGMVKLVVQKRKARMGRNPATGEPIKIPAKTVVKARIAKQLKDAVLPRFGLFRGPTPGRAPERDRRAREPRSGARVTVEGEVSPGPSSNFAATGPPSLRDRSAKALSSWTPARARIPGRRSCPCQPRCAR